MSTIPNRKLLTFCHYSLFVCLFYKGNETIQIKCTWYLISGLISYSHPTWIHASYKSISFTLHVQILYLWIKYNIILSIFRIYRSDAYYSCHSISCFSETFFGMGLSNLFQLLHSNSTLQIWCFIHQIIGERIFCVSLWIYIKNFLLGIALFGIWLLVAHDLQSTSQPSETHQEHQDRTILRLGATVPGTEVCSRCTSPS